MSDDHTRLVNDLAAQAFGARVTPAQALATGVCIRCTQPALPRCYSDAGRREYQLSALCERCFDGIFAEEPNVDDGYVDLP